MAYKIKNNELGMVSIIVTMIMMIVISLIVLGFSQVTRRNQREALDRQLSTQAYYAAESGVNFAQQAIQNAIGAGVPDDSLPGSTTCQSFPGYTPVTATLNSTNSAAFTCLLVNPTPNDLNATPLNLKSSIIWRLKDKDGKNFSSITYKWASDSGHAVGPCTETANKLYSSDARTCNFAMLRVDLVQDPEAVIAGAGTSSALAQNTITLYLQPTNTNSSPAISQAFSTASNKAIIAQCKPVSGFCSVTVNLAGGAQSSEYYTRLSTLYENSDSVDVTGKEVGGTNVSFSGGQAVVDATGKAVDVLRRIQVRVPLTKQPTSTSFPNFGLQATGSICKELTVGPSISYTNSCP